MIQLQCISKILATQDFSIITNNDIEVDSFVGYEEEFNFIKDHLSKYGNVPDKATFLEKFPSIELVEVTESDAYLIDSLNESTMYYKTVPILKNAAKMMKSDSMAAAEYLLQEIQSINNAGKTKVVDIIAQADERLKAREDRLANQSNWFFTTGLQELDDVIHGLQRGEELLVIVARTNQGKSWILAKLCTHIWELGFNIGYISPEMSANSIGYRFDTLHNSFSNKALTWGSNDSFTQEDYADYINELKTKDNKFYVATPKDFKKKITISKLREFVKQNDIHLLAVDGITYLTDERYNRGDNRTTSLTNISEDLMELSIELNIPIVVVVQSNRGGVIDKESDGTPELENIRDSDGIAHNASKVIALRQKDGVLELGIKKQRNGVVGGSLKYTWDIDVGEFNFLPSFDDAQPTEHTKRQVDETKKKYKDTADVF